MPRLAVIAGLFATLLAAPALADPQGTYRVVGIEPDYGSEYTGEVTVERTGETYYLNWVIDRKVYDGIAIGARMVGGVIKPGPSTTEDTILIVSFNTIHVYNTAIYMKQEDGSWRGYWAYEKGIKVASENWFPK